MHNTPLLERRDDGIGIKTCRRHHDPAAADIINTDMEIIGGDNPAGALR